MRRSSFIFKENCIFIEEDKSSDKVVIIEKEIDGIRNLVDLPRLMLLNEECGNLQLVMLMVESLLEIISERRSQKFYKPIDFKSVKNVIDETEVSMIFLVITVFCG